jgi:hypothetical protein
MVLLLATLLPLAADPAFPYDRGHGGFGTKSNNRIVSRTFDSCGVAYNVARAWPPA